MSLDTWIYKAVVHPTNLDVYNKVLNMLDPKTREGMMDAADILGLSFFTMRHKLNSDENIKYNIWVIYPKEDFSKLHKDYYKGASIGIVTGDAGLSERLLNNLKAAGCRYVNLVEPSKILNEIKNAGILLVNNAKKYMVSEITNF